MSGRSGIFISYRREDSRGLAGRLYDRLTLHFGPEQIFMDVDSIEPGLEFDEAISRAVASCDVLLALIGLQWLTVSEDERRRIDDPDDFVRSEIGAALDRGIRVIPVLLDGASMPSRDQLPLSLAPLSRRNSIRLDHESFTRDVAGLMEQLDRILLQSDPDTAPDSSTSNKTSRARDDFESREVNEQPLQSPRARGGPIKLLRQLSDVLGQTLLAPQQFGEVVTYEDVIGWFVDERPPGDVARSGAVLRKQRRGRRVEIMQLFLDQYDEPVRTTSGDFLGRRVVAPGVDPELDRAFNGQDLIIVE